MLIAQVSDCHVMARGGRHQTGYDPAEALGRVVDALMALRPRPDLLLFTGDLAAESGTPEEYAEARRLLAPLDLPGAAVPGNHDAREGFRCALSGSRLAVGSGPVEQIVIDAGPLRLIGLDTADPEVAPAGRLCRARLDWLDARLGEAKGRPTLIFMHHPPFAIGIDGLDRVGCLGGEAMAAVVAGHPQVRRVLCGHVHRAVQRDWAGTQASCCPSVAYAFALELDKGGVRPERHPPGFQLHAVDDDGAVLTHTVLLP
jgi:3',5'-cyclic-AMP phosphodiesterase